MTVRRPTAPVAFGLLAVMAACHPSPVAASDPGLENASCAGIHGHEAENQRLSYAIENLEREFAFTAQKPIARAGFSFRGTGSLSYLVDRDGNFVQVDSNASQQSLYIGFNETEALMGKNADGSPSFGLVAISTPPSDDSGTPRTAKLTTEQLQSLPEGLRMIEQQPFVYQRQMVTLASIYPEYLKTVTDGREHLAASTAYTGRIQKKHAEQYSRPCGPNPYLLP